MTGILLEDYLTAKPTPMEATILRQLVSRPLFYDEIERDLWGHRADGGPIWARKIVTVSVCRLRKKLRGHVAIRSISGRGYRLETRR